MEGAQLRAPTKLTTMDCGKCGGTFALNERFRLEREENGGSWYCPYCRTSWRYTESENDKLRRQLKNAEKRAEWARQDAKHAENRRRAAAGQLTKIKRRVSRGVCPCCNRTFENLAKHMESKHPDYSEG